MTKIRWGVLSTAKIARLHTIPAMQTSQLGEVVAIASRDEHNARQHADQLGIARAYGGYEALLADPDIDAIYNPMPNHLHVPWSIKALEAGKHVLVEKPAGLNVADLEPLLACAARHPELKLMEAFMYRFHPQWRQAKQLCDEGAIGRVRTIQCAFSYNNRDAGNIRNSAAMGGGALMDIGCYGISLARFLLSTEPSRVLGHMNNLGDHEVDCITSALMEFDGAIASFTCSTKTEPEQWVEIAGEAGSLRIHIPFNPVADNAAELTLKRNGTIQVRNIEPANHYRNMADAFAAAILHNKPVPTPMTDALDNMTVLDAIVSSAKQQSWISL
ncbi:Gfo/Idh/MocA family oxidoreductase [uncultured Gilvimarinus sp.]|uniref:Gfo/Idh/MocA family protein n=1 Tax=uncultured Gilvimarinus sp. TaxID=1689143 RepID=UPI0030EC404E|tara:strand:+ start:1063 stop:2052 length:990 start_codon:yes stop_codon:yes gene_type:complete